MVHIDTNVLIRLITNDVPPLREQAESLIAIRGPREVFISDTVLCELFFVLHYAPLYRYSRPAICDALQELLTRPQLHVSEQAVIAIGLTKANPRLDFTDCLLAAYAEGNAKNVLTFDKNLLRLLQPRA